MRQAEEEEGEDSEDAYSTPDEGDPEIGAGSHSITTLPPSSASALPDPSPAPPPQRQVQRWPRDVLWLLGWISHLVAVAYVSVKLGRQRWHKQTRNQTDDFWPMYGMAAGAGSCLAVFLLWLIRLRPGSTVKLAVNAVCPSLAVISVFCFWDKQFVFGAVFAVGALLQFLYSVAVMDRLAFTKLMICKAVEIVEKFPSTVWVSYCFVLVLLCWLAVWTFGVAGVVAFRENEPSQWWILLLLSMSLFWTGAVFCNTVHVTVAGSVYLGFASGVDGALPRIPILHTLFYTLAMSLGSICYGSLFTAAIRTIRWGIRGLRARCGRNECMLCCVDVLFNLVETLVRFFNKYGFVEVAIHGRGFNRASRDAWEAFQATGVEALIAHDLTGAVLLMATGVGALLTGAAGGSWCWFVKKDYVIVVGATSMLIGAMIIGLTVVVISSTVTAVYVIYAEDPALIGRVDPEFAAQMAEALHIRLQHRSGKSGLSQGLQGRARTAPMVLLPMHAQGTAT